MALKVALSGNDCMKFLPSSMLVLSWGSKGTEPVIKSNFSYADIIKVVNGYY